jgi:hypothetical protein
MMKQLAAAIAAVFIATAAAHAQQCPQVGQAAKEFALKEGFQPDPSRHSVTAGGNIDLAKCGGVPGTGWVTKLPDFVVNYKTRSGGASGATLTFRIESSADTILLINDPNNKWHWNDDGGKGLNGKLSFPRAASGRYDVWIGSLKQGQLPKAKLVVTELESSATAPAGEGAVSRGRASSQGICSHGGLPARSEPP